jgi:hypothetical protein
MSKAWISEATSTRRYGDTFCIRASSEIGRPQKVEQHIVAMDEGIGKLRDLLAKVLGVRRHCLRYGFLDIILMRISHTLKSVSDPESFAEIWTLSISIHTALMLLWRKYINGLMAGSYSGHTHCLKRLGHWRGRWVIWCVKLHWPNPTLMGYAVRGHGEYVLP